MVQPFRMKRAALAGALALGMSIAVSSASIVRASHVKPPTQCSKSTPCILESNTGSGGGVEGISTSGIAIEGISSSGTGIYGSSSTRTGIEGTTAATNGDSAVSGISTAPQCCAQGVYGRSTNGDGVQGHSSSTDRAGVSGYQTGTSNGGYGVYAESADSTSNYGAIAAQGDGASTNIFLGFNRANDVSCVMNAYADLTCSGSIYASKSLRSIHASSTGQHVLAYAAESASATLDDVGTAHMVSGAATVAIDRTFASTIDLNVPYHVFLTPMGDTRGLYVSGKTSSGFEVREAQGGRSTISFDYRIVARPIDAKNDRLPPAPAVIKLVKHVQSAQ